MPKRHLKGADPFLPKGEPRNIDKGSVPVPKASPGITEFAAAKGTKIDRTSTQPTEAVQSERAAVKAPNPPVKH